MALSRHASVDLAASESLGGSHEAHMWKSARLASISGVATVSMAASAIVGTWWKFAMFILLHGYKFCTALRIYNVEFIGINSITSSCVLRF